MPASMNFEPTQTQLALSEQTKEFAKQHLGKDLNERDATSHFRIEDWKACANQGVFGLNTPEILDGAGYDAVSYTHLTLPTIYSV